MRNQKQQKGVEEKEEEEEAYAYRLACGSDEIVI